MRNKLLIAFVILTTPLLRAQAPKSVHTLTFDRTSVYEIVHGGKDCVLGEKEGSCKVAFLKFNRMKVESSIFEGKEELVFHDPKTGEWIFTLWYYPRFCKVYKGSWFKCKQVSWRAK